MKHALGLILLLFLTACDVKKESKGEIDRIIVFGDRELFNKMHQSLDSLLGDPQEVPILEKKYSIDFKEFTDFSIYQYHKNILFLISDDINNDLSSFPKELLSAKAYSAKLLNQFNFFMVKNAYASNQAVLIFSANKKSEADSIFKAQFKILPTFQEFDAYTIKRVREDLITEAEDRDTYNKLTNEFGFSIRVPQGYTVIDLKNKKDSIFFSLLRGSPIQWISVHKTENYLKKTITIPEIIEKRNEIHHDHLEGDSVDIYGKLDYDNLNLNGMPMKRLQGSYQSYQDGSLMAGGPFIIYSYIDTVKKNLYLIDGHVFALGKRKSKTLLEVESIMRTFKLSKK